MRADLNLWLLRAPDRGEHFVQLRLDFPAQDRYFLVDIHELEESLWLDRPGSHVIPVDAQYEAAADVQTCASVHKRLKREIEQVHVFDLGAALDLDDVPLILADRIQNVGAGKSAVVNEACLEQWFPPLG